MTRSQTAFLRLLKRLNKDAAAYDKPYIRNKDTLTKIAEATDSETAKFILQSYETNSKNPPFPWLTEDVTPEDEDDESTPLELLITTAYMGTQSIRTTPDPEASKALWTIFRQALSELRIKDKPFIQISQNRAIHALAILRSDDLIRDELGGATATIHGKSGDVSFKFTKNSDGSPLEWNPTTTLMLLYLLENYANTKSQTVRINLKDYAKRRGKTAKDLRDFQEETGHALNNLAAITSVNYHEKISGKWTPSGGVGLNGGTHRVERGVIQWNWNTDLLSDLDHLAPMDFPKEGYKVDVRTNQFQIIYYIAKNYRLNEGRKRQNIIKISSLLQNLPGIPSIDKVRQQRQSARSKIIRPVIRDLDAFESFTYDVIDEDGNIIANPENMKYEDFIKASLSINYTDWPSHEERLENRERREKKKKQEKKPVSKSGGEVDAEPGEKSTRNRGEVDAGETGNH